MNTRNVSSGRINALFDGLVAIAITIMVLNLQLPPDSSPESILAFLQSIGVFFVTFVVVAYQWNRHQQLMDDVDRLSYGAVWHTIVFLFFIALMPFFTKWLIQNPGNLTPALGYDLVFICAEISFRALVFAVFKSRESSPAFEEKMQGLLRQMKEEYQSLDPRSKKAKKLARRMTRGESHVVDENRAAKELARRFEGGTFFAIRMIGYLTMMALGVGISILNPFASIVLFVALPILSSLSNVIFDRSHKEGRTRSTNKCEDKDERLTQITTSETQSEI